ncbi:hypothetical protein [Cetobacterium sp. ZWU0022]|uniref:hypothetical protein n=1 Tax=Cetobacterium sp. ZWU0022 TaxID=1340502 RepID=UPI000648CF70|nr:hypothetical protein [Cetobacterium sp. ZWU0022]
MKENFFNNFIVNFYDKIETEFESLMKKEKAKKLSVLNLEVDAIDYLDGSKTPIIETIKEGEHGIEIFLKNKDMIPSAYSIEDIFHSFSLAVLADKLIKKDRYVKILEDFYVQSEELVKDHLKHLNVKTLSITEDEYEVLAISKASGAYKVGAGIVKEIFLNNDRVFFNIDGYDEELITAHIVECSAADLAMLLNNILFPENVEEI